jgi:hypothetical protein
MAEVASVALGMAALFDTCIEGFKIVFAAQDFAEDFEVLRTRSWQQRLQFLLWSESVGLVPRYTSTPRPYLEELNNEYIRATVLKSLGSIRYLFQQFKVYESRYSLKNDATLSLVNISGPREMNSRFVAQTRRNQKQKSLKAVIRLAVFDSQKVKDTIEQLNNLVDGLVDATDQLTQLRTVARSAGNRYSGLASMTSGIHIVEPMNARAIEIVSTPSFYSRQIRP